VSVADPHTGAGQEFGVGATLVPIRTVHDTPWLDDRSI